MKSRPWNVPFSRRSISRKVRCSHNNCIVGQGYWKGQNQLFPNDRGLSNTFQRLVLGLDKIIQGLRESLSGCTQGLLSLRIVRVPFCVDFIASSAEVISGENIGSVDQWVGCKVYGVRGSDAELPRGRFVGIHRPRRCFGARDMFRE